MIRVVSLSDYSLLPIAAVNAISAADTAVLQSDKVPAAEDVRREAKEVHTLDRIFERAGDFDELYRMGAAEIARLAANKDVVFCALGDVYGNGFVKELAKTEELEFINCFCGAEQALFLAGQYIGSVDNYSVIGARSIDAAYIDSSSALVVSGIDDAYTAANVKLKLLDSYSPDQSIVFVCGSKAREMKLAEMDRVSDFVDGAYAVIAPVPLMRKTVYTFNDLVEVMKKLRGKGGCPWDIKQTHETLRQYLLEEAYEVIDAVDAGDMAALYDELGDVLLQVVFHAEIGRQHGEFDYTDVTSAVCSKLIKRHPHIFADGDADTPEAVVKKWEEIKREEKGNETFVSVLKDVPRTMGAMMRAYKLQKKAAAIGFDWDSAELAFEKVEEETKEFKNELSRGDDAALEREAGDLIFAIINVLRKKSINPEVALTGMCEKFIARFEYMEKHSGSEIYKLDIEQMEELWTASKNTIP